MKAMIFAAGLGTRLKPLTDNIPKALVPVCGKPLLEHVLGRLRCHGFEEAVINVHHFADKIETWIHEQDWICTDPGMKTNDTMLVQVSDERERLLETGGAILHARPYLEGCGMFMIHNVDIFSDCDFGWLVSQTKNDSLATLLVSPRKSSRSLLFDPDTMRLVGWKNENTGEIRPAAGIDESECLKYAFSGIHVMSDKVLEVMDDYARRKGMYDSSPAPVFSVIDFYLDICSLYYVYGVVAEDLNLVDVGKMDTLAMAEEFMMKL